MPTVHRVDVTSTTLYYCKELQLYTVAFISFAFTQVLMTRPLSEFANTMLSKEDTKLKMRKQLSTHSNLKGNQSVKVLLHDLASNKDT